MSWTDLFKSRSSSPKPDPQIRWFGKLPTYPDYYRSQADEDWANEFNNWILKGYEMYKGRVTGSNHGPTRLPVSAVIARLPESRMCVFASVLDFGGDMRGRTFPMCFYAALPSAVFPGPKDERATTAMDVLKHLLSLRRDVTRFLNSPGRFESYFERREVNLFDIEEGRTETGWVEAGRGVPMGDWFNKAAPSMRIKKLSRWLEQTKNWGAHIKGRDGKSFEPSLGFPLAPEIGTDLQVAGWLSWLGRHMALDKRFLSLMVTESNDLSCGRLTVLVRDIIDDDFLLLTPHFATLPYVDNLASMGSDSDEEVPEDDVQDGMTWTDFVTSKGNSS